MQPPQPRPRKLLDQVQDAIRVKHYSYRTEQTYVQWVHRTFTFEPCSGEMRSQLAVRIGLSFVGMTRKLTLVSERSLPLFGGMLMDGVTQYSS